MYQKQQMQYPTLYMMFQWQQIGNLHSLESSFSSIPLLMEYENPFSSPITNGHLHLSREFTSQYALNKNNEYKNL